MDDSKSHKYPIELCYTSSKDEIKSQFRLPMDKTSEFWNCWNSGHDDAKAIFQMPSIMDKNSSWLSPFGLKRLMWSQKPLQIWTKVTLCCKDGSYPIHREKLLGKCRSGNRMRKINWCKYLLRRNQLVVQLSYITWAEQNCSREKSWTNPDFITGQK